MLFRVLNLRGGFRALIVLGGVLVSGPASAADEPPDRDEELLKASGLKIDADSLAELLRSRSPEGVGLKRLEQRIAQWKSDDFKERDQATKELLQWGQLVRQAVEEAAKDADPEVANRAKEVLKTINREIYLVQPRLAARLLVKRWPGQAVEPLLYHLPFADEETAEEIVFALDALVVKQGPVPGPLLKALQDKAAERRAAAAVIVGRRGNPEQRVTVEKLLDDAAPLVRLRAAQGLLAAKDKGGLPTLVALLDEPDVAVSWSAEELLHWTAGDTAPEAIVGGATAEERQKCRAGWEAWHKEHAAKVDLVQRYAEVRRPGLMLVCTNTPENKSKPCQVFLRGCDGKPRWRYESYWRLDAWEDAQLLPGNRVLFNGVRERNLQGEVVWEGPDWVSGTKRLANGNFFLASNRPALNSQEFNRAGEVVVAYHKLTMEQGDEHYLPNHLHGNEEMRKLEDGRLVWLDPEGGLGEHDAETGRLLKKVPLDPKLKGVKPIDALPNGHWLFRWSPEPEPDAGKKPWLKPQGWLAELDGTGKVVWKSRVWASWAVRLRNGHTLAVSHDLVDTHAKYPALVELDRDGKRLWEDYRKTTITRVRECLPLVSLGFDEPPSSVPDFDSVELRASGLKDKDRDVRHRSLVFLKEMGPKAWASVVPSLVEALGDTDDRIPRVAEELLMGVGRPALPAILEVMNDKRPTVRARAITLVGSLKTRGEIPQEAKSLVPKVLAAAHDEEAIVRRKAMFVLSAFADVSEQAIPALIQALKDKDVVENKGELSVSAAAAFYLGNKRQPTPEIMSALIEATQAPDDKLRRIALYGVGRLAAKDRRFASQAVEVLRSALRGKDFVKEMSDVGLRSAAAASLGMLKADAKAAVPDLIEALRAEGAPDAQTASWIRLNVLFALGEIGPDAKAAVPHLIAILESKNSSQEERKKVVEALKRIDPEAKLPELPNR